MTDAVHPLDAGHTGPLVFVDDLDAPVLSDRDREHLRRSLRLRDGAEVVVGDGEGRWRPARLGSELDVTGPTVSVGALSSQFTIGFPAVKGDRTDWAVQKLTEIGADRIMILMTDRSVVRWVGERADKHLARLRRIAREAAMQSRRLHLPDVGGVTSLSDIASGRSDIDPAAAALADRSGQPLNASTSTVLIGPEGGWSDAERELGMTSVTLSHNVLRVETAALVAAVSLTQARSVQVDDRGECW